MIIKYIDRFQANAPNLRSKEIFLPKQLDKKVANPHRTSWDGQEITNGWEAQMVHLSELVTSRMCIFVSHDVSYLIIFVGELPLRDLLKWICWPWFFLRNSCWDAMWHYFWRSIKCIGCWNMCSFDYLIEASFLLLGTGCYKGQCLTKCCQKSKWMKSWNCLGSISPFLL